MGPASRSTQALIVAFFFFSPLSKSHAVLIDHRTVTLQASRVTTVHSQHAEYRGNDTSLIIFGHEHHCNDMCLKICRKKGEQAARRE